MKEIFVGELQPDETVDAMREARLLSNVGLFVHIYLIDIFNILEAENGNYSFFRLLSERITQA